MTDLQRRVKTALILLPLFVAAVLWLPSIWLAGLLGLVVLLGAWEWAHLCGLNEPMQRGAFVLATLVLLVGLGWGGLAATWSAALFWVALLWWAFALGAIIWFQAGGELVWPRGGWALGLGWVIVIPPWLGIWALHQDPTFGPGWVLCLLCVVWVADIGAYFCGRRFGRRKLASRVSPGKTVEGIVGALLIGSVLAFVGIATLGWQPLWLVLVVVLATVLMSVLGDLAESMMKRQAGVKDSGSLLPGHGGVLDRIDSLTAAVPFFVLCASAIRSAA
ncbi:MAG: phosphatidate cytidylyltransferase [Pseudomonadota bacterium]